MSINNLNATAFEIHEVADEENAQVIFISTSSASTSATSSSCA